MDERQALDALKRRDEGALAWFIDRYTPYASAIVLHITGAYLSNADREEIVSDVFLALWKNADRVLPEKVKAYLSGTARNMSRAALRKAGQDLPLEDDLLPGIETDPQGELERREQARLVRGALLAMDYPDREIFLRHYYYCQPLAQIGEEMDMNPATVKTRLHRGREKLRDKLLKGDFFHEDI